MITYYKSQKDVAEALRILIDDYWEMNLEETEFIDKLNTIINENTEKVYKNDDFTALLKQRLGKKRIALIKKIYKGDV